MEKMITSFKNKALIVIILLLSSLFAFALFKNIAYPLLWNDEAETAMFATRILEYGYPKAHDGRNTLCLLELPIEFGVKEKNDAYIGSTWGQYYFSVIGASLAERVKDIYAKTALLRIPFAFIGFAGLVIMALSVIGLYKKNLTAKLMFLMIFIFFELLSISLILHLREARHYPIGIFLSACIFYSYINYGILKKATTVTYISTMTLLLLLVFNTFPPLYFIFIIAIGLYELFNFLRKRQVYNFAINTSPLFISLIPIFFLLSFFETFRISGELAKIYAITPPLQYTFILELLAFFQKYEFLNLILAIKVILAILYLYIRISKISPSDNKIKETGQKLWASNFFSLFFIIYILVITKMPVPVIYQRYFIILQPISTIILLLDIFITFELIGRINPLNTKNITTLFVLFLICLLFMQGGLNKIGRIKNYIYELSHQYKGPLDFVIPYIKSKYDKPGRLVIATNYEECSYMYYLGSRVIIGYVGNNLEEDLKIQPDVIIFRKRWAYTSSPQIFNVFFKNESYKKIAFPVFDYPVNNIPELYSSPQHLYETKMAESENKQLDIYIKQ